MPIIFLLLTILTSFAQDRRTQNHFALIGGGGEPHRAPTTIFDHEVQGFGEFMNGSRGAWQSRAAFNGGHTSTEAMVDRLFGQSPNFSPESYNDMLNHYKEQLSSGRIGRGDQLMIQIASHGAFRRPGEKSHGISAGGGMVDLTTGRGSELVDLDKLQEIIALANTNGVKLAIIDTSCHSGSTLALANDKTCVISSSGPNHFASGHYIGFGARFSRELRRGRNLEEVFQRTISQRAMPTAYGNQIPPVYGFPMISSPGGRRIQDEIYPLLTPYLYNSETNSALDKFDPFLRNTIQDDPTCQEPIANFQNLVRQIQSIDSASRRLQMQPLLTALQNYENLQRQLREGLAATNAPDLSQTEEFCRPKPPAYGPGNLCQTVKLSDLMLMGFSTAINSLTNQASTLTGPSRDYALMQIQLYTTMQARSEELKNHPSRRYLSSMNDLPQRTSTMVREIYTELHKVYPTMYQEEARRLSAEPNPCRDFTL